MVNKADRPGADEAVKDLRQMLNLGTPRNDWRTPVLKTSSQANTGIDELIAAVQQHRDWAAKSGEAQRRIADAMRSEIQALLRERVLRDLARRMDPQSLDNVVALVAEKRLDPYGAVEELLGPEKDQ